MSQTIFERYGGFAKVSRIVIHFYDKVLDSPVTGHYFASTDMKQLIDHQTKFIATLMGGPASYTHEQLARVHLHLGISEAAFEETCLLLRETLEDFDFSAEDIKYLVKEFMSYKNDIVKRG